MKTLKLRYLSLADVLEVGLTMADVIQMVEAVLVEHGHNRFENPPKPGVHPLSDAFIHAMPGYLPAKQSCGLKWVSGFSGNDHFGMPAIMGLIVLNDVKTGQPLAIMDGSYITAVRTAAVSAVAARHLARKNVETIGMVGAGIQGRYHLLSFKEVLPDIKRLKIYDHVPAAVDRFKTVLAESLPPTVDVCETMQDVFRGADMVITATGQLDDRIFRLDWLEPGMLALPIHTRGWEQAVIAGADKFVVDDWGQFSTVMGGRDGYYAPLPAAPYAQLGEIVVGRKPGRENDAEKIINFNFGMAIHDIHVATAVLQKAEARSIGQMLPFLDAGMPLS